MKRKAISLTTLFFMMTSLFLNLAPHASAQTGQEMSPDIDGDGLPNTVEEAGWYNGAGGPFVTNALDPDSDNDGLSDGEEKLFDADPLNSASPGIYVVYEDACKTKEYYP